MLHLLYVVKVILFLHQLYFSLCRPPLSAGKGEASLSSSSLSVRDVLRQRYSVTWHPRLLYLIVSDGYMATVMRVLDRPSPAMLLRTLLKDVSKDLEKASCILDKSQVTNQTILKGRLSYLASASACAFYFNNMYFLTLIFPDSCEGLVGVRILYESCWQP